MKSTIKTLGLIAATLILAVASASAQGYHTRSGYTTRNGTYVAPSHATNPNSTTSDNWSTKGNTNPFTGQEGTRSPSARTPSYNGSYGGSYNSGYTGGYGTRR